MNHRHSARTHAMLAASAAAFATSAMPTTGHSIYKHDDTGLAPRCGPTIEPDTALAGAASTNVVKADDSEHAGACAGTQQMQQQVSSSGQQLEDGIAAKPTTGLNGAEPQSF